MTKKLVFAAIAVAAIGASGAQASPTILSFGAENGGVPQLNYYGFANYAVSTGSVDLIGDGYFDNYPGNGLYVDLAGSTQQFGALTTDTVFGPGNYAISVSLGGPIYNGITDGAKISWGTGSKSYTLAGLAELNDTFDVTLTNPEQFTISDLKMSGNTDIGATLFGFQVVDPPARVPEPVTISLFGAGLAGAAAMRRRRKAKKAQLTSV